MEYRQHNQPGCGGCLLLLVMLALCAVATVVVGALTGGWFGDAIQKFVLASREKE